MIPFRDFHVIGYLRYQVLGTKGISAGFTRQAELNVTSVAYMY
eukprot:COSAG03_NODE_5492_length_1237_cov_1.787346_2_plen_42_part_01